MEQVLAEMAGRNKGLVRRRDLLVAGVTRHEVNHRLHTGALIKAHDGIYRVGHRAPSTAATYLAAVWACGDGAVLSGLAAAYHYGLIKGRPPVPEVTSPTERRVKGVLTHRARRVTAAATTHRGIPILSVPAVLVDIAQRMAIRELARACHEAGVRYRTTPRQVDAVLARKPNAAGAAKLRMIVGGDFHVTLSKLERGFLARLREANQPLPVTNRVASGRRVDCRWREHKLTVELVSFQFHNSRYSWEQDHQRRREARARGDEFRSYTWHDVFEAPESMLAELEGLLPSV